jgi:hypothetical protein
MGTEIPLTEYWISSMEASKKRFISDFEKFTDKIKSSDSFAYARYADGEVALMQGRGVGASSQAYAVDKWSAPNQLTLVGKELMESLAHEEDNYYYAISTPGDSVADYNFLRSNIRTNNITYANLWINANYQRMKSFYQSLEKPVYVICNQAAKPENFPFKVVELFPFPDDCIWYWTNFGEEYSKQLLDYTSQLHNQTIFVSAGPVSEILIHRMYVANPNNQYIDVGSSIDEFVHGRQTRPYMNPSSVYSQQVSYFENEQ